MGRHCGRRGRRVGVILLLKLLSWSVFGFDFVSAWHQREEIGV